MPGSITRRRGSVEVVFAKPAFTLVCLFWAWLLWASGACAQDHRYQFELGPSAGVLQRVLEPNRDGIHYSSALAKGLHLRVTVAPWLKVTMRYLMSSHEVGIPPNSLGIQSSHFAADPVRMTALSGYIHPTWNATERFHMWATFGIGWGKIDMSPVTLDAPASLPARGGVFLEAPLGAGFAWDIIRGWCTLSYDVMYAPAFSQSGDLYDETPYINRQGGLSAVGPMPRLNGSFFHLVSLSLALLIQFSWGELGME